jgi:hypothetical protein
MGRNRDEDECEVGAEEPAKEGTGDLAHAAMDSRDASRRLDRRCSDAASLYEKECRRAHLPCVAL